MAHRKEISKSKLCKTINDAIANLKKNIQITKQFSDQLKYCGNLVLDGKYIPVKEAEIKEKNIQGKIPRSWKRRRVRKGKVLIWGVDYTSHDIPHYEFDISENSFVFEEYFKNLKEINYDLKSLTIDDKREIIWITNKYYPNCIIQLCIKHYMAKINRILCVDLIRIRIISLENKIETLFVDKDSEYIPTTRPWSIKRAAQWSNEIAELEFKYELLIDFQNIIKSILHSEKYNSALYKIKSLEEYFWPRCFNMREQYPKEQIEKVKKLFTDFKEHQEYLINYLKYPHLNIPNTTNLIEGYNSQLETRLSSIKGFETIKTAENYINAWIIKRRFTKFTDCKKQFKKLNKKTPLGCAGVDISHVQNWVEFSQKKPLKK